MNSNFVRLPFINNKNGKYEYVDDVGCLRDGRDMCDVCVAADPRSIIIVPRHSTDSLAGGAIFAPE